MSKKQILLLLPAIIGLGIFLRSPSLSFPIWLGDESYYTGLAQNFLSGQPNYVNDYHNITPGISYLYSLVLYFFGLNNMFAIHLLTLFVYSATTFIIYRLTTHIGGVKAGLLAALLFSVYNVCFNPIWCFSSLPEPFLIFFNTLGIYILFHQKKKSALLSGMILAVSVFFKQSELLLILTALIYLTLFSPHQIISFLTGTAIVFFIAWLILTAQGAWGDFWYQNFETVIQTLSRRRSLSGSHGSMAPTGELIYWSMKSHFLAWGGAMASVIYSFTPKIKLFLKHVKQPRVERENLHPILQKKHELLLIVIWSLLYIAAFFSVRRIYPYYIILLLPPLTILGGIGLSIMGHYLHGRNRRIAVLLLVSVLFINYRQEGLPFMKKILKYMINHHQVPLFNRLPSDNYNPTLVNKVIRHTKNTERVLIWGWYCWVNTLANRRFGIGLLVTEKLSSKKISPQFLQYLYQKLEHQLKENGPEVIIDFPGESNSKRITEYPELMKWIKEHYSTQPFLNGTLYRKFDQPHSLKVSFMSRKHARSLSDLGVRSEASDKSRIFFRTFAA